MFKIVILCGHAEKYIEACLNSFLCQDYTNWIAQVMVDPMGDKTYNVAKKYESDKIKIKKNEKRRYALGNTVEGIKLLNPDNDNVLITMDGDDWLSSPRALSVIYDTYYENPQLLLTHGSWRAWPNPDVPENNEAYSRDEFRSNIRKSRWKASQLRTFKYKLWKHVDDKDLRDVEGNYFTAAGDCAYMWPMMEMAGYDRVKFIEDRIYIYNQENPHGDSVENVKKQMYFTDYIAAKPQYKYMEKL